MSGWAEMQDGSVRGGGPCALCGVNPAWGVASISYSTGRTLWLCHDDDHPDCYVRWTVYGERPLPTMVEMTGHRTWAEIRDERPIDLEAVGQERQLFDVLTRLELAWATKSPLLVQPEEAKAILIALEG
jgi:hypothetical protein